MPQAETTSSPSQDFTVSAHANPDSSHTSVAVFKDAPNQWAKGGMVFVTTKGHLVSTCHGGQACPGLGQTPRACPSAITIRAQNQSQNSWAEGGNSHHSQSKNYGQVRKEKKSMNTRQVINLTNTQNAN